MAKRRSPLGNARHMEPSIDKRNPTMKRKAKPCIRVDQESDVASVSSGTIPCSSSPDSPRPKARRNLSISSLIDCQHVEAKSYGFSY